jgi:hypothetical protein
VWVFNTSSGKLGERVRRQGVGSIMTDSIAGMKNIQTALKETKENSLGTLLLSMSPRGVGRVDWDSILKIATLTRRKCGRCGSGGNSRKTARTI